MIPGVVTVEASRSNIQVHLKARLRNGTNPGHRANGRRTKLARSVHIVYFGHADLLVGLYEECCVRFPVPVERYVL